MCDCVGARVGHRVGELVGELDGFIVGDRVGNGVGLLLGERAAEPGLELAGMGREFLRSHSLGGGYEDGYGDNQN